MAYLSEVFERHQMRMMSLNFPDRKGPVGHLLGAYLKREVEIRDPRSLHLLFTADRWERAEEIRRHVEVCDEPEMRLRIDCESRRG